jgi:hypothetical protein
MINRNLALRAFLSVLGATAYIALVAVFFSFADRLIGKTDGSILPQMSALLLIVFSVLVMGILLLLQPLRLYFDGKKADGVQLLLWTGVWLGIITLVTMFVMALI